MHPSSLYICGEGAVKAGKPQRGTLSLSPESSVFVEVTSNASVILEGENLHFSCSVRTVGRPQSRFSVIWQLVDRQNRRSNIMWLDRDGTVQSGASYWERSSFGAVQMEQVQPNSFSLNIFNSRKEDEGQYECHVTEWVRAVDGEWQIVGERRASTPVSITALGKSAAGTLSVRPLGRLLPGEASYPDLCQSEAWQATEGTFKGFN